MTTLFGGACVAFALCNPLPVMATEAHELEAIRQEIEALRKAYETRIEELERRLQQAEAAAEDARVASEAGKESFDKAIVATEAIAEAEQGRPTPQILSNAFNPAISVILQGKVNTYSQDPDTYQLAGFQLGEEAAELPKEGPSLDETELDFSANIDQIFYGSTTVALEQEEGDTKVEVEEAYAETLGLPYGFNTRFGRWFSNIGYLNRIHSHAWDFQDQPLVYRGFLANQYFDDGVQVTWVAPTDMFLQFGGEAFAGSRFPAGENNSNFGNSRTLFAKTGGDVGPSHSWQAGISGLWVDAHDRQGTGEEESETRFSGGSNTYIADLVWKWAPHGNPAEHNLTLQTEVFYRDEDGPYAVSFDGMDGILDYDGDQWGWYTQAVYQFMPHWRAGLRYDRLSPDNDLRVTSLGTFTTAAELVEASGLDDSDDPHRWSAMFDWSPSEFSRLRLQYNRDNSRQNETDNQWTLQYIMSLGSHGAHEF